MGTAVSPTPPEGVLHWPALPASEPVVPFQQPGDGGLTRIPIYCSLRILGHFLWTIKPGRGKGRTSAQICLMSEIYS